MEQPPPLKFQLLDGDGSIIEEMQEGIYLEIEVIETWDLGEGRDALRFDEDDFHYIANFHTRDYELEDGELTATVYDADGNELGNITFEVSSDINVNRGRGPPLR